MQRSQWPIHIGTLYTLVKIVEDIIDKCLFGTSTNVGLMKKNYSNFKIKNLSTGVRKIYPKELKYFNPYIFATW